MAGETRRTPLRWLPVPPARRRTTVAARSPGSRIVAVAPPSRCEPVASWGGAPRPQLRGQRGLRPASAGGPARPGPARRGAPCPRARRQARLPGAIRDVWRDVNARPRAVQLWHAFAAADASRGTTRYAPQALMNNAAIPAELRARDFTARFSRGAGGLATRRRRRLAG